MSRRDTIIIAVLINACLLVVLFATSITRKEEPHYASNHELPFSPPSSSIKFEDIERSLVQDTKSLDETFPLQAPLITQPQTAKTNHLPILAEEKMPLKDEPKNVKYMEVTVKSGDYLERIGRENNVSAAEIMSYNNLKTTQLRIGQVLRIPVKEEGESKAKTPTRQYVVKMGDTPWKIANDHNMKLEDLLKINHLDKESSKQLQPGDTLYIR